MTQLKLWKYRKDFYRLGVIEGLFIATEEDIDRFLLSKNIVLGDVLGKHSDVYIYFTKEDFKCLDVSETTIYDLFISTDNRGISGYNPFEYIGEYLECKECHAKNFFVDCYDNKLFQFYFYCPDCGSSNLFIEDD